MFRSAITLALSLFLLAEASAQTTPAAADKKVAKAAQKQTKAGVRAAKKAAKQSDRLARKPATKSAVASTNDGWPPIEDASVVASTVPVEAQQEVYDYVPVHNRHEDVVYAAPGSAVRIQTSKAPVPYSVRPPRKPAAQTTLGR